MAYVNPDSILTGSLSAIQAAASAFDRAEARRKEQEQLDLNRTAGEFVALNMPKFRDGKLIEESPDVKYNSPEFKKFANSKYVKPYLMEGVPEYIKDVEYLGMTKTGTREDGTPLYTPTARWLDDDGKEISRGPITVYRSKDPNDPVAQFTPDDLYNFGAAALYKQDPTLGRMAHGIVMDQARGGVVAAYRQAATPEDKAAILNSAAKYWKPSDITAAAAGPLRVENLQKGGYDVDDGNGNRSFVPDDQVKEKAKKVNLFQTDQEVERQKSLSEGRLAFEEGTKDRQLKLDADKITNQYETQLRNKLAHSEDELRLESARIVNNYVTNLGLDKQYAGEKLKLLTEEIIARVKATAGANYEAAPTVKKTNEVLNPVPAQDEKGLLQAREILNPSAVSTLLSKGETVADQTVLDWAPKLTTNDLQGLYAGLARAYQNGNPAAAKPLESVRRILHDAAADKTEGGEAETFKPAKFSYDLMSNAIKGSGLGEDALTVARPQMMQKVGRLAQDFGIPDDNEVLKSQAHLAALDAYQLEHDQDDAMFKGRAYSNAEGPMFLRRYIESTGIKSVGKSPREFMDKIYTPIVNETGLNITDPKQRNDLLKLTALASSVMDNGVDRDDAVATVISLTKDPAKAARAAEAMKGDSESARISSMGQALASEIKTRRQNSMKSTLREGADFTFGGGMWR